MTIISNATVVGLGVGLVFFGLICLIAICHLLGFVMRLIGKKNTEPAVKAESVKSAVNAASLPDAVNRQELFAAVAAAIAEELGTDTEAIRIKSIRQL